MTDTDTTPDLDGNVKFEGKYIVTVDSERNEPFE